MAEMNPWKLTSIGLLVVGVTAGVTAYVMGGKNTVSDAIPRQETTAQHAVSKPEHKAVPVQHAQPPESVVLACNKQVEDKVASQTEEVVKDGALGAAITGEWARPRERLPMAEKVPGKEPRSAAS